MKQKLPCPLSRKEDPTKYAVVFHSTPNRVYEYYGWHTLRYKLKLDADELDTLLTTGEVVTNRAKISRVGPLTAEDWHKHILRAQALSPELQFYDAQDDDPSAPPWLR